MFQKTNSIAPARIAISSLIAILAIGLGGCSGLQMGVDSERSRAVNGGYQAGQSLAVLLPETGRFAGAAQVVHNGIVAAREADPQGRRPTLRFYNSADGSVVELVQRAAADGATLVIGPLQKPEVDKIASASALPIPVLALNQATAARKLPQYLYQFALSPEDEAIEVADKAWGQGHRNALMIYPEGNWGSRLSRAFLQAWKAQGGTMAATQVYDPNTADYSAFVASLSERASDADMVFLIATSNLAREIWPQIRQKLGPQVPVYATSHVYGGRFDPQNDRSLVGLHFVEIPWLIEPGSGDAVSAKGLQGELPQLYAMGVDAYRLGSRLGWMSNNPGARMQGKTGILRMDSHRRIHRELTLARIDAGGPTKTAAIDAQGMNAFARAVAQHGAVPPRLAAIGSPRFVTVDR